VEQDELNNALKDFRLSVHAWSEAAYLRPRKAVGLGRRRIWRLATEWALGCVLVVGGISTGTWEHHLRNMEMRSAAARAAEQERLAVQQRDQQAREEEEDLLAKVDSVVSREVPRALEPLAQLMAENDTE
jgi:hypothetical protein